MIVSFLSIISGKKCFCDRRIMKAMAEFHMLGKKAYYKQGATRNILFDLPVPI